MSLFQSHRLLVTVSQRTTTTRSLSTGNAILPKRHSRHGVPPTCLDAAQLQELTQEIRESKPGSLYSFSKDSQEAAWNAANVAVQKTEFVLRGHAARIPNTVWHRVFKSEQGEFPEMARMETMQSLIERLQQEGELYMNLRKEVLGQVQVIDEMDATSSTNVHDIEDPAGELYADQEELDLEKEADFFFSDSPNATTKQKEKNDSSQPLDFASPGPTVTMYDTLLDSMAVTYIPDTPHSNTPKSVGTILETIMERYNQDGASQNTNIYTTPTAMTFNAVLRTIANSEYNQNNEQARDAALYYSFGTYDAMRNVVERNSATYTYMLQICKKYLIPSRTRGNIAHGLWMQARKEHVVDRQVVEALYQAHEPSNGTEFEEWMQRHMEQKEVAPKFQQNARVRRHNKRYATY